MPPKLVLCHCCACGCVALSVCEVCERAELTALALRRDAATNDYIRQAWDELVKSYRLDEADEVDRETDRAGEHMTLWDIG